MQGMTRIAFHSIRLLLAFGLASSAHAQDVAPAAASDADVALAIEATRAILDAEAPGRAIYLHDRAAAVATDAVMELKAFRQDSKQGRLAGWITEQRGDDVVVTFLGSEPEPRARYRVTVANNGQVSGEVDVLAEPAPLSAYERGAARARATAAAATFERCARTYNTVVLPDTREGGGWIVYLLPGTTKQGIVPIGGSYRLELDAAGDRVVKQRGFTRSCIALENPPDSAAMMITHLLDPRPTEVHVFWSLWAGKPMFVGTSTGLWKIEDGRVTMSSRAEKKSP